MDDEVLLSWRDSGVRYFSPGEFDDPTQPGSGDKMNIEAVKIFDSIRNDVGFPFTVDSGWRSPVNNIAVGGKTDSAHLSGVAIDIACVESWKRFKIVESAVKHKVKRIGIGENFIHLDCSLSLPQEVLWLYPPKATPVSQKET